MKTALPIYYQIKQTIKNWIIKKEFAPGEKVPSEMSLAAKFKVNRVTIHQAFSELIQEGFLISKRGEGTFVTDNENLINSFSLEFSGVMNSLFFHQISKVKTKAVFINRVQPSKLVKSKLELNSEDKEVVEIKRIRVSRDRLFAYTLNYLPLDIGNRITEKELYAKPLLQTLEENLGIQLTETVQVIEATFANQEIAKYLDMPSGLPILFVERIMYGNNHKPVDLFQSFYNGETYRLIVRLKNVKRKSGNTWVQV